MSKEEKVVVTGGAGFIGSHIVDRLVNDGYRVVVIDDLSTGDKKNIEHILDKIEFIEGSITDTKLLDSAFLDATFVLHQAALPSVPKSIKFPQETNATNITGTLNVFEAARKAGVSRVVYASSSSVYCDSPTLPKVETMEYNPLSPYAAQKMMCEYYGKLYHKIFGLETVGLRYFNVFGPRQNPESEYAAVIPKFITNIKNDNPVTIFGDGETSRDFTYIDNVVEINIQATKAKDVAGEIFNVACGEQYTLNQLAEKIGRVCGKEVDCQYSDFREGDIKQSLADIKKAQEKLGYAPKVTFDEGLKKAAAFY